MELPLEGAEVAMKLMLLPDVAAAVCGADGATISAIRQSSGCRMLLLDPSDEAGTRYMQLAGSGDAVCTCIGLILAEVHKSCSTNTAVMTQEKQPAGDVAPSFTLRFLVKTEAVGSLIGKAGSVIIGIT